MAFVITEACIDVKDGACVNACPVDCIYEGGRMFYIQPDECVNCGVCVSICPVEAIYADDELPPGNDDFARINREFFENGVTGWGMPGGLSDTFRTKLDHPLVASAVAPRRSPALPSEQAELPQRLHTQAEGPVSSDP